MNLNRSGIKNIREKRVLAQFSSILLFFVYYLRLSIFVLRLDVEGHGLGLEFIDFGLQLLEFLLTHHHGFHHAGEVITSIGVHLLELNDLLFESHLGRRQLVHVERLIHGRNGPVVHLEVDEALVHKPAELEPIIEAIAHEVATLFDDAAHVLRRTVVVPVIEVHIGASHVIFRARNALAHEVDARDLADLEFILKECGQGVFIIVPHVAIDHGEIIGQEGDVDARPSILLQRKGVLGVRLLLREEKAHVVHGLSIVEVNVERVQVAGCIHQLGIGAAAPIIALVR